MMMKDRGEVWAMAPPQCSDTPDWWGRTNTHTAHHDHHDHDHDSEDDDDDYYEEEDRKGC